MIKGLVVSKWDGCDSMTSHPNQRFEWSAMTTPEILVICDDRVRESNWVVSLRSFHRGLIITTDQIGSGITPSVMRLQSNGGVIFDVQNETGVNIELSLKMIRKLKAGIRILVVGRPNDTALQVVVNQIGARWMDDETAVASANSRSESQIQFVFEQGERTRLSLFDDDGRFRKLAELEAEVISQAIIHCFGNLLRTSVALGIGRSTLYRKIDEYRLSRPDKVDRNDHAGMPDFEVNPISSISDSHSENQS
jgi:hypothetical protein